MSETPIKKRGRPKGSKSGYTKKEPTEHQREYASNSVAFLRESMKKRKYYRHSAKDVPDLYKAFDEYLDLCERTGNKPGNLQAYAALGITKENFNRWKNAKDEELRTFAEYVDGFFSSYREKLALDGEIDRAVVIFWQKNFDGFKDTQEHVITASNPIGEVQDESELAKRYLESADIAELPLESKSVIDIIPEKETVKEALD